MTRHNTHSLARGMIGLYISVAPACLLLPAPTPMHASDDTPEIPVELQIELDSQDYLVGENFTFTVRIVNPNSYPIELRRFGFNDNAPQMELLLPGGDEYRRFPAGDHESPSTSNVTIAPGDSVEYHRFFYVSFGKDQWRLPTGRYRLRAVADLHVAAPVQGRGAILLRLASEDTSFTLHSPPGGEQRAFEFLRSRWLEWEELVRSGGQDWIQHHLQLYDEFLRRFTESAYAPEVRLGAAKLLTRELLNSRSSVYEDEHFVDLYEECLTFCLDRGGAFADDFLHLRGYADGRGVMEIAAKYHKDKLLARVAEELDERFPDDKEGILYRRVFVANASRSPEEAADLAKALLRDFPNGKYTDYAKYVLEQHLQGQTPAAPGGQ